MKIGFEVHEQLDSRRKLYCDCPTNYRDVPPNTNVCPICTGMPGSKPMPPNEKAIESAIEIALMLDCEIIVDEPIYIQRKHYDYPDLPSGYQRTSLPIAVDGKLKGISIREVHIEEDPGKYNPPKGTVDFNRSGIPLVEVITDPDLKSPEEARDFLRSLIRTLEYTERVRPEPSTLRADTNISLKGGKRVEIKNINSVKGAFRAMKYEVMRQKRTESVKRETRAYLESQMITVPMRSKEEAEDYRYIPDPDILPILIDQKQVEQARERMHEAPHLRKRRIIENYEIDPDVAEVLISEKEFIDLFETVTDEVDPDFASHWFKDVLKKVLNYMDLKPSELPFSTQKLIKLMKAIESNDITPEQGELVLREMSKEPEDPEKLIKKLGLEEIGKNEIISAIEKAMEENEEAVKDFKNGKEEALNFLAGQVMQITDNRADPRDVMEILKERLSE